MNGTNGVSDEVLDRLVDGELSTEEQRELLTRLESEPDGWRRCATAFLEAQAWTAALSETAPPPAPASPNLLKQKSTRRGRTAGSNWFSVAVVIIAAFGLGVSSNRWADWSDLGTRPGAGVVRSGQADANDSDDAVPRDSITLVVDGEDGQPQELELPVVEMPQEHRWFDRQSASNQAQFIHDQLRRAGRQVTVRNQYWAPIETEEGERIVVPIEQWELAPVSHRDFQ